MRTLPAACCLLIASLALGADAARAQFRLSLPGGEGPFPSRFRTEVRPPTVSEMLLNEGLQWELKLTDEQIDRLEDTEATVKQRHQEEADRLARLRQESMEAGRALRQKTEREQQEVMQSILTPVQWDRVRQIEIQLAGPAAFSDPAVQQTLRLTEAQREALEKTLTEVRDSYTEESRRARRGGAPAGAGGGRPAPGRTAGLEKRITELSQRALKKLEAQLTAEQKQRWAALVGAPCDAVTKLNRPAFLRLAPLMVSLRRGRPSVTPLRPDEISEGLREELKLSEEQATRIGNLPGVIAEGHQDEEKQIAKRQEEQQKAQATLEGRQAAEMAKAMTAALEPEQRRRLEQIQLQVLGLAAWDDPVVRKALKLTADQQAALQKARAEARANAGELLMKAMTEASREPGGDYQRRQRLRERKAAAAYRAVTERLLAQLTPEQQKQWRELTGPPVRLRVDFDTQGP